MPPLPDESTHPNEYQKEKEKRNQHEEQLRKVDFRAARNVQVDETAATAFGNVLKNEQSQYNSGPATRSTTNAEFYSKQLLKNILNKVTKEILGIDAVVN